MATDDTRPDQRRNRRFGVEDLWAKTVYEVDPATGKKTGKKVPSKLHGKGKRWRARYVDDQGQEHTQRFAIKAEAQAWLDQQTASLVRGLHVTPREAKITIAQWCDRWLEGYAGKRKNSVRNARTQLTQIKAEFGPRPLSTVRSSDIKAWTAKLKNSGFKDSSIYTLHSRMRQLLGDAIEDGLLARNPCTRKTTPPMGKQKCYVATTEQIWGLLDAVPRSIKTAVLLGAFVGLRVSEASGAWRTDMDFMKRIFTPARQWGDEPLKTSMSATPIPVSEDFTMLLSATILPGDHTHLVTDDDGKPVSPWQIERAIREARESSLVDLPETFTFHDLRHYNASWLIASGEDIKTVQARIRHGSAKTTLDVYGHLWPDADESSREAMSAIIGPRLQMLESLA